MEDLALAEEPVAMVLDQQARIFLEGFDAHWAFTKFCSLRTQHGISLVIYICICFLLSGTRLLLVN